MDDNARPYRGLLVDEFLESEDIRRMDWPAGSPDLNLIEHVSKGQLQPHPPRTIQGMKTALLKCSGVGPIAPRTDKLPYFKYDITLRDLHMTCVTTIFASRKTIDPRQDQTRKLAPPKRTRYL
ncbi:DDE_3 domain-containing protein [Trichonephila clavipes]|nr:DDE_3 domain-containing protein [Trichonephila clavipes]